jgi:L-threonylcarbamoyladenylate synthase
VLYDLDGKIHAILDGGECKVGVESTIIDLTSNRPKLLRAGGMPIELLEEKLGKIEVVKSSTVALCPGMKYKHYSPKAPVFLFLPSTDMQDKIIKKYDTYSGKAVIFALNSNIVKYGDRTVYNVGKNAEDYAHNLFDFLRKADKEEFDVILCEGVDDSGFGLGVMNRLIKASADNIVE